jgi:hypothetical protein
MDAPEGHSTVCPLAGVHQFSTFPAHCISNILKPLFGPCHSLKCVMTDEPTQ